MSVNYADDTVCYKATNDIFGKISPSVETTPEASDSFLVLPVIVLAAVLVFAMRRRNSDEK